MSEDDELLDILRANNEDLQAEINRLRRVVKLLNNELDGFRSCTCPRGLDPHCEAHR